MHRKIENFDGASSTKTYIFFFQKKKNEKNKNGTKEISYLKRIDCRENGSRIYLGGLIFPN